MENSFRIEPIVTKKDIHLTPKGFIKIFTNTKNHLPVDIDINNRFGILCAEGEQYLEQFRKFKVRKDDVWVITMPKCGTTWMLEMVWMLVNNFDYDTAMKIDQYKRCTFLEHVAINPSYNTIEEANNMKSPRVLKSHLPMHMLPEELWTVKPKIVYVARDPKDAIVSYYHFFHGLGHYLASVEDTVAANDKDIILFGPFWSHVIEFWNLRNEPNVYFTSFERMKKDLRLEILKVSKLLEKSISQEQLDKLVEHLTFDKMKDNQSCNNVRMVSDIQKKNGIAEKPLGVFIRSGKVGTHKNDLSTESIRTLDAWTQRSTTFHGITAEEILLS